MFEKSTNNGTDFNYIFSSFKSRSCRSTCRRRHRRNLSSVSSRHQMTFETTSSPTTLPEAVRRLNNLTHVARSTTEILTLFQRFNLNNALCCNSWVSNAAREKKNGSPMCRHSETSANFRRKPLCIDDDMNLDVTRRQRSDDNELGRREISWTSPVNYLVGSQLFNIFCWPNAMCLCQLINCKCARTDTGACAIGQRWGWHVNRWQMARTNET